MNQNNTMPEIIETTKDQDNVYRIDTRLNREPYLLCACERLNFLKYWANSKYEGKFDRWIELKKYEAYSMDTLSIHLNNVLNTYGIEIFNTALEMMGYNINNETKGN